MKNFKIEVEKLNYLYDNLLSGVVAVFLLSVIFLYTLSGLVPIFNLSLWFSLNTVLMFVRIFLYFYYKKVLINQDNHSTYYYLFFTLSTINAIIWGGSAFFIFPQEIHYQMIMLLLIGGMTTAASLSFASKLQVFYPYVFLTLLPFIFVFYLRDTEAYNILSISLFVYILTLLSLAKKISIGVNNNILLAYENQELILQLEDKVDEANVANRAKSEFLSIMSHEIRTPLNAIIGFIQILQKSENDKKKKKYLDIVDESSQVLTNIINDILDLSKIESGKFILEMNKFTPKDEFESLYFLFEQNAIQKNIYFVNAISSDLPATATSDILRIKQIVSNILSNAIKFTPEGKTIELIVDFDKDTSSFYIEVKDEGIGMSEENIKNVTQAFMQADSSTARKYGGTGLGLSIVTKLLKLFDSELNIKSEINVGSRVSFKFKEGAGKLAESKED